MLMIFSVSAMVINNREKRLKRNVSLSFLAVIKLQMVDSKKE